MPTSPQLRGEAEGPATIDCFVYVVANVYSTSPFGTREVCGEPPSSSPDGAPSGLGRGAVCVRGPGARVCSARHRLLRRVWELSPGPERPVRACTRPAPASPGPGDSLNWAIKPPCLCCLGEPWAPKPMCPGSCPSFCLLQTRCPVGTS